MQRIILNWSATPKILVILVTGGVGEALISVEVLNNDGTPLCMLSDLPNERFLHTMNNDMLCGGNASKSFFFMMYLSRLNINRCRDVLFEYHRAVVPFCWTVRPVRSLSTL